jgi:hypothetical protein
MGTAAGASALRGAGLPGPKDAASTAPPSADPPLPADPGAAPPPVPVPSSDPAAPPVPRRAARPTACSYRAACPGRVARAVSSVRRGGRGVGGRGAAHPPDDRARRHGHRPGRLDVGHREQLAGPARPQRPGHPLTGGDRVRPRRGLDVAGAAATRRPRA